MIYDIRSDDSPNAPWGSRGGFLPSLYEMCAPPRGEVGGWGPGPQLRLELQELKLAWFLKEEYQTIVDLESANPRDPAAIKAAYEEAVHVANLATSSMPELHTPFKAVVGLKEDMGKLLAEQARTASLLGAVDKSTVMVGREVNFVARAVAKVEKAVGKLAGAVAAVPRTSKKRKRG
ncbi:hypothetical protein VF21_10652 [Pseudogymnoascus sp. 05NY08]|nr:hypothetical protein VF21_10652 [Pseudogymnoascus sp. 05NY08]